MRPFVGGKEISRAGSEEEAVVEHVHEDGEADGAGAEFDPALDEAEAEEGREVGRQATG